MQAQTCVFHATISKRYGRALPAPKLSMSLKEALREILLITLIFLILHIPFYSSYPPIDFGGDESWYMDYSIEFIKSGSLKGSIFPHTPANEVSPFASYLYNGILSLIFLLSGFDLNSARLLSLISGLGVVLTTYILGRRYFNKETGIIASIYLATSIFFSFSHQVRPEALFTFLLLISYYLFYRYLEVGDAIFIFLSGLTTFLLIEVHLNAIIVGLSLVMMYLVLYRSFKRRLRDILYLFGGFFFASLIWIFINYIPTRGLYTISSFKTIHKDYTPVILEGDIREYLDTLMRSFSTDFDILFRDGYLNNLDMEIYFFLGLSLFILYLIYSRHELKKTILFMVTILSLWLSSIILSLRVCQFSYTIYFMPFMSLLYGWFIYTLYRDLRLAILRIFIIGVAFITLFLNIYDTIDTGMRLRDAKKGYIKALTTLRDSLPPDKRVIGSSNYYQVLYGRNTLQNYLFMQNSCPDFSMMVRVLDTEYIILDDMLRNLSIMWCSQRYYDKIISFLKNNAELVRSIYLEYPNLNGTNGILREIHLFKVKPSFH